MACVNSLYFSVHGREGASGLLTPQQDQLCCLSPLTNCFLPLYLPVLLTAKLTCLLVCALRHADQYIVRLQSPLPFTHFTCFYCLLAMFESYIPFGRVRYASHLYQYVQLGGYFVLPKVSFFGKYKCMRIYSVVDICKHTSMAKYV